MISAWISERTLIMLGVGAARAEAIWCTIARIGRGSGSRPVYTSTIYLLSYFCFLSRPKLFRLFVFLYDSFWHAYI